MEIIANNTTLQVMIILLIFFIIGGAITILHTKWYKFGIYVSGSSLIAAIVYILIATNE